jgi:hypothetical protein
VLADRAGADVLNEIANDPEVYIRFEKSHADLPHGLLDVLLRQYAAAPELLEDSFQLFRQIFEHDRQPSLHAFGTFVPECMRHGTQPSPDLRRDSPSP